MGRFASKFRARMLHSLRGQIVAAILAVMILAFQLWLGVIPRDARANAWWSLAWPYLILIALFLLWHGIGAWRDLKKEDRGHAIGVRSYASGQAAQMFTFEAQATELILQLELLWQHWNNVGEVLVYPLGDNPLKNLDHYGSIDLELRDFRLIYRMHLERVGLDIPKFRSTAMVGGYLSNREYAIVLRDLREHAQGLGDIAKDLYETGVPL